ncbi:MAG TPA: hypothetical protein DEA55_02755 [Rhodospirillaceae bacterium]|nr:hypothetical protein [Rhodospirillaceae bacterium]
MLECNRKAADLILAEKIVQKISDAYNLSTGARLSCSIKEEMMRSTYQFLHFGSDVFPKTVIETDFRDGQWTKCRVSTFSEGSNETSALAIDSDGQGYLELRCDQ